MSQVVSEYMAELSSTIGQLGVEQIDSLVGILDRARAEGACVYLFGNGGSAATASHFACDLLKNTVKPGHERLRVVALNDNVPTLAAYANDVGYEAVFAEPLRVMARPGDVAIGISYSGESPNVLRAIEVADDLQMTTVGMTGGTGGSLRGKVGLSVHVPSEEIRRVEDVHLAICHAVHLALT